MKKASGPTIVHPPSDSTRRLHRFLTRCDATFVAGAALVVAACAWHVWMAPAWTDRLRAGWTWRSHFVGVMTWADPSSLTLPVRDSVAYYDRVVSAVREGDRPGSLMMEDTNTILDTEGRNKIWEYTYRAAVDRRTGAFLDPAHEDDFYVFPRRVEKKTYRLRQSYLEGIPLTFQREEHLEDVLTYLFAYRGRGEYTISYTTGTPEFRPLRIPEGHQIRCADDQFVFRVWVEPVTGEIVKLQESCRSGDYVYDGTADTRLQPVARWAGESSGDDVRFRLERARGERLRVLAFGVCTAPALFGMGLLIAVLGLVRRARA